MCPAHAPIVRVTQRKFPFFVLDWKVDGSASSAVWRQHVPIHFTLSISCKDNILSTECNHFLLQTWRQTFFIRKKNFLTILLLWLFRPSKLTYKVDHSPVCFRISLVRLLLLRSPSLPKASLSRSFVWRPPFMVQTRNSGRSFLYVRFFCLSFSDHKLPLQYPPVIVLVPLCVSRLTFSFLGFIYFIALEMLFWKKSKLVIWNGFNLENQICKMSASLNFFTTNNL